MTRLFRSLILTLLSFATISTTVSQDCPGLFLKAKARPNAKRGILAGKGYAKITVTLSSKDPVDELQFQLNLPKGLSVERTKTHPSIKPHASPQIVEDTDGMTAIYWLGIAFTKSKGGKRRFRVKLKADKCAPDTLAVDAFAYLVNATEASCITSLSNSVILRTRYSKLHKAATCAPTPAPTINPTQPFVLLGEGQRFSQGGHLAPPQYTAQACYEYCSLNAGEATSFFFSSNTVTGKCFCCVSECRPFIFDPNFNVYEALLAKTSPPTSMPTTQPTAAPSSAPSMQPRPYRVANLSLSGSEYNLATAFVSGDYAYFGTDDFGVVVKVNLTDFTKAGSLPLNQGSTFAQGENKLRSSVVSGSYGYFGTGTEPGIVVKVNLTDFTRVGNVTLNEGENDLTSAVVSGNYAYFGTSTVRGIVVKINLTDFTRVGNLTLESDESYLVTAVLNGDYAYFGTNTSPGKVVKVNLTDFTRVGRLTLNQGENNLRTSLNMIGNYAYFGTSTQPGIVVKVNLTDFTRVSNLTLESGQNFLVSSVLSEDCAYFGTDTEPGRVIQVNLTDFTNANEVILNPGEDYLVSAAVSEDYAYFGTDTGPAIVVKVAI